MNKNTIGNNERQQMYKSIFAVILNWNNYSDTRACIESLQKSDYPLARIIVIDNGSHDDSVARLLNDYSRNVNIHIICNKSNYGFARGVNVGIRYALKHGAEFVLLVNNDAVVDQTCIKQLMIIMETKKNTGIAGPRILQQDNTNKICGYGYYYSRFKTGAICPEHNKLVKNCPHHTREVAALAGCIMLVRSKVFEDIGLFNEQYFFYEEDIDFCLRASRAGFKIFYVPPARAWHGIASVPRERTSPFVLYHRARSRIIFLGKNLSWLQFQWGLFLHLVLYTPFRCLQVFRGSKSWQSIWAWFKGSWAGMQELLKHPSRRC